MSRLMFICPREPDPSARADHETDVLMMRCVHCRRWALAGYRCVCGQEDTDPRDKLMGHGPGECVEG